MIPTKKILKAVDLVTTILGTALPVVTDWVKKKKMDDMIVDVIEKKLTERMKDGKGF